MNQELSASLEKKAKKELHEEKQHVPAHLESFSRWVQSLPHISYPYDPALLIPFLRHAKYNHAKAQKRLDNFCTLRASPSLGMPQWFEPLPLNHPAIDMYLKLGVFVELGRTKDDVLFLLVRFGNLDFETLDRLLFRRANLMDLDRFVLQPATQIAGIGFICDMTGITMKQMTMGINKKDMKMETKIRQDGYPFRMKYLIYYNEPTFVDALFKLLEAWISKKMRDRMIRVKNKLEKAYEKVPGLREIMPAEYGGGNLPLAALIEQNERRFREFYSRPSPFRDIKVNEQRRPDSAKNLMREYIDVDTKIFGTEGTYIKYDPGD